MEALRRTGGRALLSALIVIGGSVALCDPASGTSVAITLNRLSMDSSSTTGRMTFGYFICSHRKNAGTPMANQRKRGRGLNGFIPSRDFAVFRS